MMVWFVGGPGDGDTWDCPEDVAIFEWEEQRKGGVCYGHYWRESPTVFRFGGYRSQPIAGKL